MNLPRLASATVIIHIGLAFIIAPLPAADAAADPELQRMLLRPGRERPAIAAQFDTDKNGILNKSERIEARRHLHRLAEASVVEAFKKQDKDQDGKVSASELDSARNNPLNGTDANKDELIELDEAKLAVYRAERGSEALGTIVRLPDAENIQPRNERNTNAGLYDIDSLRTFFFEFEDDDWLAEMHDFYHSDVNVPADLIVDGERYKDVGVRYRGNSSFFMMGPNKKRSLNLTMNHAKNGGDLYGYQSLNLHNGAEDPTFMREVLYLRICRDYIPAFRANFVKVVVNGESWGIYLNVQQYNDDFAKDWFGSKQGIRWKVAGGPGKKGLSYEGDEPKAYAGYQLKSSAATNSALKDLIQLCRVLHQTPAAELETALAPIFNIDGALWSLALENVFVDEGYFIRISDYDIFQDKNGRFHLLQHDGNEVFNLPHGPGLPRGFDSTKLDLFHNTDNPDYAVLHRLLKIPHLRARYLAHVRTLLDEWFRWESIEPVIARYRDLITEEVHRDGRKLYSNEDYDQGLLAKVARGEVLAIKDFIDRRRAFLLAHAALQEPPPVVSQVDTVVADGKPIAVKARIKSQANIKSAWLYWAEQRNAPYSRVEMKDDGAHADGAANDGLYGASIPVQPKDSRLHYYVEARQGGDSVTSSFYPAKAEAAALTLITR